MVLILSSELKEIQRSLNPDRSPYIQGTYSKTCRNHPKLCFYYKHMMKEIMCKQPLGLAWPGIHPSGQFKSSLVTSCQNPMRYEWGNLPVPSRVGTRWRPNGRRIMLLLRPAAACKARHMAGLFCVLF